MFAIQASDKWNSLQVGRDAKHLLAVALNTPLLVPSKNGNNKENRLTLRAIQKIGSGQVNKFCMGP